MKVLGANSFILGTRKLWRSFPIKQKFDTTAAFWDKPKCSIFPNLDIFLPMCSRRISRPGGQGNCTMDNQKNCLVLNIFITRMVWKKAAVIFNFCLIGNIHHNFLVPRMLESAPKTFMPIQTPDLHGVKCEKNTHYLKLQKCMNFLHLHSKPTFLTSSKFNRVTKSTLEKSEMIPIKVRKYKKSKLEGCQCN